MTRIPPLDVHAHVNPRIEDAELGLLDGAVFAATRSLDEAAIALERSDRLVVWGVGCHPGVAKAQAGFSEGQFSSLLDRSAFAGELGLDAKSRVPMPKQRDVLRQALGVLQTKPRLTSLHSFGATEELLEEMEQTPSSGVILHWWLGDAPQTDQAIRLGAFVSVNPSSVRRIETLSHLPLERVLTETDHPYGDRFSPAPRRPGAVMAVEAALARHFGIAAVALRQQVWRNLGTLAAEAECSRLLPRSMRSQLAVMQ